MSQLPAEILDKGTRNHMMADILALNADGKAIETVAGKNHILSAYGEHSKELVSKKCLWVDTHELGGITMAHGLIATQIDWSWWGSLAGLVIFALVFWIMLSGKLAGNLMPKMTDAERKEQDDREAEHFKDWGKK